MTAPIAAKLKRTPLAWRDPVEAFAPLRDRPFALLMHGARRRWSYICANPIARMHQPVGDGAASLAQLGEIAQRHEFERPDDAPPFCGGWAGLASFEFGRTILPRLEQGPDRDGWPDLALGFYQEFIAFDHETRRAEHWCWNWAPAPADALDLIHLTALATPTEHAGPLCATPPQARVTPEDYAQRIARTVAYVHAGDCFQANISQRFDFELAEGAHPFDLTLRLDRSSAAPFSAFFRLPGLALASNSPERFLKVRPAPKGGLKVSTKPIKGTRPRGATPDEDKALAAELIASEKDQAENLMIVDLMRNDLSRVSTPGTVKVPQLAALESYANVHHLVSTVEGELTPAHDLGDLIAAAFPGGSVTGAPKIRAMQIIAELEDEARGPYCGSLVWMTPDGWMDSSILIRSTALEETELGRWRGHYRSGGGIVADSSPAEEYTETLDKAAAIVKALTQSPNVAPTDIVFLGEHRQASPVVSTQDRAFLLGDGCFETLRVCEGAVEGAREHLQLLRRSMKTLEIAGTPSDEVLLGALNHAAIGVKGEGALRITVSRGAGGRGAGEGAPPLTVLSASQLAHGRPYPALNVETSAIRRNESSPLTTLKATSYGDNLAARRGAVARGADEALMLNMAGRVACLAMGNLVLVTPDGRWLTPSVSEGARPGYARSKLADLLTMRGHRLEETQLTPADLVEDGVSLFGCNSLWGLRPIRALDGRCLLLRTPIPL